MKIPVGIGLSIDLSIAGEDTLRVGGSTILSGLQNRIGVSQQNLQFVLDFCDILISKIDCLEIDIYFTLLMIKYIDNWYLDY